MRSAYVSEGRSDPLQQVTAARQPRKKFAMSLQQATLYEATAIATIVCLKPANRCRVMLNG
jgi:hypothetical protein